MKKIALLALTVVSVGAGCGGVSPETEPSIRWQQAPDGQRMFHCAVAYDADDGDAEGFWCYEPDAGDR